MVCPGRTPVIAIVGAGFSGTLLASQLLRQAQRPLRLLLIERTGRFGPGVAYGTHDPGHLLNVSADAMSAWADDPSHLLRWLDLNRSALADRLPSAVGAGTFLPRQVYGLYLQSILEQSASQAAAHTSLARLELELIDLEPLPASGSQDAGYRLHFNGQAPVQADQVVLALGNSALPPGPAPSQAIRHGWAADAVADLNPDASVALLGSGLTMVDLVVSLQRQGHRGPIVAISRRGLRPNAHRRVEPLGDWLDLDEAPASVLGLLRLIRRRVAEASQQNLDWRAVIDGLRPRTQQLWSRLPTRERRRFLRHVSVIWDVHRHRIAPELMALLDELQTRGRLRILAARLLEHDVDGERLRLQIRHRGAMGKGGALGEGETIRVDRLILCTGIPLDYGIGHNTLVARLRERGLLQPDALGLGTACDAGGALLNAGGHAQLSLHTLGSPRKGQLWESIAVPELRVQARDLAQRLLASGPRQLQGLPPLEPVTTVSDLESDTAFLGMFI